MSNVYNTGNPNNSTFKHCSGGHIVSYGSGAITYTNPPTSQAQAGKLLFDQTCSSCHGSQANGVAPNGQASIGPNLQGVGAATVDFWITTGRMPAVNVKAIEAERKPPVLTNAQALQVAAYINSLDPAVPAVPTPHLNAADVSDGADLFSLNCAACHTITGAGDALAFGTNAPTLHNKRVTPQQIVEAIRIGPANMPRFSGNLSDAQVRDVVAYVTQNIQHPVEPGRCRPRAAWARWPRASSPCSSASAGWCSSASGSESARERRRTTNRRAPRCRCRSRPSMIRTCGDAARNPERVEAIVGGIFVLAIVFIAGFGVAYWQNWNPWILGGTIGAGLFLLGFGLTAWGKYLMPQGPFVEERHVLASSDRGTRLDVGGAGRADGGGGQAPQAAGRPLRPGRRHLRHRRHVPAPSLPGPAAG